MADLVTLVCRTDGTWDHRWYPPLNEQTARAAVVEILRSIANQLETGNDIPNPGFDLTAACTCGHQYREHLADLSACAECEVWEPVHLRCNGFKQEQP